MTQDVKPDEVKDVEKAYQNLLETVTAVHASLNAPDILTRLAETLTKSFAVSSVCICDWQPVTGFSTIVARYTLPEVETSGIKESIGTTYDLINEVGRNDLEQYFNYPLILQVDDPDIADWEKTHLERFGGQSALILPLKLKQDIIGFVEFREHRYRREFTAQEIELGQAISQQAAITLTHAKLYEAEAKRRQEAETLYEVSRVLASTLDIHEVLNRTVAAICNYLNGIHNCVLTVLQEDGRYLQVKYVWFDKPEHDLLPEAEGFWLDEAPFCHLALKNQEPVTVIDLWQASLLNQRVINLKENGLRSLMYLPLIVHDKKVGLLHIHVVNRPRKFLVEEISLCQGVANQVAVAIENANLYSMQQRQLKLSQMLQKVGSLLTASLSLEEVYTYIFDYLDEIIQYDSVAIYLENPFTGQILLEAGRGFADLERVKKLVVDYADEWLRRIPIPPGYFVVPDTKEDPTWVFLPGLEKIRSWVGAVLMVNDQLIGILSLDSDYGGHYDEEAGKIISSFANQAAIAIGNARLHNQVSQQADELAILHQISNATAVTVELDELLFRTTEMMTNRLYPHVFGFVMIDEQNGQLYPHPSFFGIPENYLDQPILYESIIGYVAQTGEAKIFEDVATEPLYQYGIPVEGMASAIYIPVKISDFIVGVICAENPRPGTFSEKDLNFLMTLAGKMAVALERAKLYEALVSQTTTLASEVDRQTQELQKEQDRTLAILENAGEGIVLTDPEANILYVNPAMEKMSGYTKIELRDKNLQIFSNKQTSKIIFQSMWRAMQSFERWSGEILNERKDGSTYTVSLTTTPIKDSEGKISGYVTVQSDISKLKEVDRLKAEFISNVSHELRTPLTNIKTYTSLLERGKSENFPRYFNILYLQIERLNRLIQDMLDVSRLDTEFLPDPNAATDLEAVLKELRDYFSEAIAFKSLHYEQNLPENSHLTVNMDENHLRKALTNIIDNAVLYSNNNGHISIISNYEWQRDKRFILVQVQDDGPGIPEGERTRIFDRFYRGENANSGNIPGTGLGLAIAKTIIERYGGTIELDNNVAVGSCFNLWLPGFN